MSETVLDHCNGESYITYCTGEKKWLNKLRKQMEKDPDNVIITAENPDGSLVVRLPYSWFQAPRPPRKVNMTDEQREAKAEHMRKLAAQKHNS